MDKVMRARWFAMMAHTSVGQIRKYTEVDYHTHPWTVCARLRTFTDDEDMLCAAALHDVVEDCSDFFMPQALLLYNIDLAFGPRVSSLVLGLTSPYEDLRIGNREHRKAMELARLKQAHADVQTIKYCDIIHNVSEIKSMRPLSYAGDYVEKCHHAVLSMDRGLFEARSCAMNAVYAAREELAIMQRYGRGKNHDSMETRSRSS